MVVALIPMMLGWSAVQQPTVTIRALDAKSRPMSRVKVYVCGPAQGELAGVTDSRGMLKGAEGTYYVGLASNGEMAVAVERPRLVFGSEAAVTLHVVDQLGAPIAGQRVTIRPTRERSPLQKCGVIYPPPELPKELLSRLQGTTDRDGRIRFPRLPKGIGFAVITDVGLPDEMMFYGAAFAGRETAVLIRHDCEISGQVTGTALRPVPPGYKLTVTDTGFGHMSGYPGRDLKETTVDGEGNYRFTGLPNCTFIVNGQPPRDLEHLPTILEQRPPGADWSVANNDIAEHEGSQSWGPSLKLKDRSNRWDFRLSAPATVVVSVRNPHHKPTKPFYVMTADTGFNVSYGSDSFYLPAGTHKITLERDGRVENQVLATRTVTVKEGSFSMVEFTL